MASTVYAEHVGLNLQLAPNIGEMAYWYTRIGKMKMAAKIRFMLQDSGLIGST